MKNIDHPSHYLQPNWIAVIRDSASPAEKNRHLHPDQMELIYQQKWFKALVPKVYGGLELSLPHVLHLEESLSWADGSLGWTVTLCAGAGWFGGFLNPRTCKEIFDTKQVCLAGSGAPSGTAAVVDGGYFVNGSWRFATGTRHATHFTANCIVQQDGKTIYNGDGSPLILPFVFDKASVTILEDRKTFGLVATGSHAFCINQSHIGRERSFKIDPSATVIHHPLYKYPFLQLAETTLAANISGMAIHFTDLCYEIFADRIRHKKWNTEQQKIINQLLKRCTHQINEARRSFYSAVELSWEPLGQEYITDENIWKTVSKTSRALAKISRQCVDELFPYCGLIAADPDAEINRVWRDLHTASQHSLLNLG